uniref:Peptide-methionine (R)-S-oxide reductase n=1 Tax=Oryza nivara TaxID=4536 RepID=A0A0E0HDW8_ORYNI
MVMRQYAAATAASSSFRARPRARPSCLPAAALPLAPCCGVAWSRASYRRASVRAMGAASSSSSSSSSSSPSPQGQAQAQAQGKPNYSTSLTDEEWRKRLTKDQYYITRQKGTERAFTGEYWNTKTPGIYHCVCCDTPLFESSTKFDSGTGWPSYYQPIGDNVKCKLDMSIIFMPRTEVLCAVCDAHLGHVFDDGPRPTGKRYCINSLPTVDPKAHTCIGANYN